MLRLGFGHLQLWILEVQGDSNVPIILEGKGPSGQAPVVVFQVLQEVELVHHDWDYRNGSWVDRTNCPLDRVVVRSRSQIVKPDALFVVFLGIKWAHDIVKKNRS